MPLSTRRNRPRQEATAVHYVFPTRCRFCSIHDRGHAFQSLRNKLCDKPDRFRHLDAVQLIKHALGLRNQARKRGLKAVLVYLHAEPARWPNGVAIPSADRLKHAAEAREFVKLVKGCEVKVCTCTYRELLRAMRSSPFPDVQAHAKAVAKRFNP